MTSETWLQSTYLGTIAMWVMIIGIGVLFYISRDPKHSKTSRKSSKK